MKRSPKDYRTTTPRSFVSAFIAVLMGYLNNCTNNAQRMALRKYLLN
jgi:hypothetical protein